MEAPKKAVKKAAKKKAPVKKATPKKGTPKKVAEKKVDAKKVTPKKTTSKKVAKKTVTKKAAVKKVVADDLKKIEGIGPKIATTLATAGITTFAKLAKTKSDAISKIIAEVRGNHVTDTWPKQAKLAADGKWDALKKWQDELNGGKAK
ncbi:DUF4332 domain-containing protein [Winogradskyella eckloniae]|uniref:DUF4332 domain-containing protein n=1 Tax=Winogradskyella eckloniae TaxID=1089306 RepID=UPI003743F469